MQSGRHLVVWRRFSSWRHRPARAEGLAAATSGRWAPPLGADRVIRTCASPSERLLQLFRQELLIDRGLPGDRPVRFADQFQSFGHLLQGAFVESAGRPLAFVAEVLRNIFCNVFRLLLPHLGIDLHRLVAERINIVHAALMYLDHLPYGVGMFLREFPRGNADEPGHAGDEVGEAEYDAIALGLERQDRIDEWSRIAAARVEHRQTAAKSAGPNKLGFAGHAGILQRQSVEKLAG